MAVCWLMWHSRVPKRLFSIAAHAARVLAANGVDCRHLPAGAIARLQYRVAAHIRCQLPFHMLAVLLFSHTRAGTHLHVVSMCDDAALAALPLPCVLWLLFAAPALLLCIRCPHARCVVSFHGCHIGKKLQTWVSPTVQCTSTCHCF